MRIAFFILLVFANIITVNAHNANIKGYKDENSNYISNCNNKYYGYHKYNSKNHWHEVSFSDGVWKIVNSKNQYDKDPCDSLRKEVTFKRCVDGDTAIFKLNNTDIKIRFLAVDTPESVHPKKDVEFYGKEASESTCNLLTNASKIEIEYDTNSDKVDKYDRHLAWIWIDGVLLQEIMVGNGFAKVAYIYGNYKYVDKLCAAQSDAKDQRIGIWKYDVESGYCENTGFKNSDEITPRAIYTVTFVDDGKKTKTTVIDGMKVKEIEPTQRIGYEFIGWYSEDELYDFDLPVNKSLVLTAKYKINYMYLIFIIIVILLFKYKKGKKYGKRNKKGIKYN